jgi:hypothetical protein
MPPELYYVAGGLVALGLVWAGYRLFAPAERTKRALARAVATPIGEAKEGVAKVVGVVEAIETLTAPISGRACVYYEAVVHEVGNRSRNLLIRETRSCDFLVRDETGVARVEMTHVEPKVEKDAYVRAGELPEPTAELEALLARHGHAGRAKRARLAYREGAIEVGERVSVLGAVAREPDPGAKSAGGYRDPPTRAVLRSGPGVVLELSDDDATFS